MIGGFSKWRSSWEDWTDMRLARSFGDIHNIRKESFNRIRKWRGSTNLREGSRIWGSDWKGSYWARLLILWSSLTSIEGKSIFNEESLPRRKMLCRVLRIWILWGQLNRLTIGRRCWAKLLAWSVRLIRNINLWRMRLELMKRRRPQYISIIILPLSIGWLIRLRKRWRAPENIQGYIDSLGLHFIASILLMEGLSISKKAGSY